MKMMYVEWEDAASMAVWHRAEDHKLILIKSSGFLASEDKNSLTLSCSRDEENDFWGACITIPKTWIKKKKVLK
jgi:hypothetical protein